LLNRKEPARVWTVFINAAKRGAVSVLFQEWAFEDQFATSATPVAFSTSQSQGCNCLPFAKVCNYEAPYLALGLPRSQFCIGKLARANALRESLFE
jgi:hypothetical protein